MKPLVGWTSLEAVMNYRVSSPANRDFVRIDYLQGNYEEIAVAALDDGIGQLAAHGKQSFCW